MLRILTLITIITFAATVSGKKGYGPGEQDWGYVDVRKGAHMFYWLYYTTADVPDYTDRPLAIWLQGGPGGSSTGVGNFEEFGPLDVDGNSRNHTWVKDMNVLFIDNPVGTGFSYVDSTMQLTRTNKQIALDLVALMKGFYKQHKKFVNVPLHIFSQSYGGKMAPEFALELHRAIKRGEVKSNLKSVNLGSPWMSPIDSVLSWAPLLLHMGLVDENGHKNIMIEANETAEAVENGQWFKATLDWSKTQEAVQKETHGIDFYNILSTIHAETFESKVARFMSQKKDLTYQNLILYGDEDDDDDYESELSALMRGPVSEALKIPPNVKWGKQSSLVFNTLSVDFMKPVLHIVQELLDTTDVQVSVISGQLDLICATPGTVNGVARTTWKSKSDYNEAQRLPINMNNVVEGYEKNAGKFTMFWVNRAGHNIPRENSAGYDHILQKITKYNQVVKYSFL